MEGSKAFQQISTFLLQIGIFNSGACKNISDDHLQSCWDYVLLLKTSIYSIYMYCACDASIISDNPAA